MHATGSPPSAPPPPAPPPAGSGDEQEDRALLATLVALTFITGLVDAVSYLGLGRVFTANMTGNVVLLGFALAGAGGLGVLPTLVSLSAFLVGSAAGGRLGIALSEQRRRWVMVALGIEAAVTAVAAVSAIGLHASTSSDRRYLVIALLAGAMGVRNATVRRLAVPDMNTTVLTMTLTALAAESRLGGGHGRRTPRRLAAVLAMLAGAIVGGLLTRDHMLLTIALIVVLVLGTTTAYATYGASSKAPRAG